MKKILFVSFAVIALTIFSFSALAWVEPSETPAAGNVSAPLHQGVEAQTKIGSLTISGDTSATVKGLMVGGDGNNGSNALILQDATQNLIYGNVDVASQGNLLNLQVEGFTKFIIDKDGNVGIGTLTPSTTLHVIDNITLQTAVVGQGNTILRFLESFGSDETPNGTGMYLDYSANNNKLNFDSYTSGVLTNNVMTVMRDGQVGIGTTNPRTESSGSLHIKTVGGGALMLEGAADENGSILMMEHAGAISPTNIHWAHSIRSNNKDYLMFGYDGTIFKDFLRFKWDTGDTFFEVGNVGIGTTAPDAQLDVADVFSAGGKNLLLGDDAFLSDIDVANTLGIYGNQNNAIASIKLGSGGGTITGENSNIIINGQIQHNLGIVSTGVGNNTVIGNARGVGANDLQTYRSGSDQVASGGYSTLSGGQNNRSSGAYSVVGGGRNIVSSATYSMVGGGKYCTASGEASSVLGGRENTASALYSTVGGGKNNTASGDYSFAAGRRAKATAGGVFALSDSQDADFTVGTTNVFGARFSGGYWLTGGNVGIGTTNPGTYKLNIAGSGYLGAAGWVYSSDARLKENIKYLQEGLDIVKQLKPAEFDYIKGDKKQVGFIAQEVQKILPNIVTEGEDGMLGMKTESIIPYLVKAIQEQQKEIEILKTKINAK